MRASASAGGQVSERYATLIGDQIEASLPASEPLRHLYGPVAEYPRRGGKRLRPAICMAACEMFGTAADEVLEIATALELVHNAFLIHDDIEDGSLRRRGLPTLHERVGTGLALNAGDALAGLSLEQLARAAHRHPRLAPQMMTEFAHLLRRSTEGQAVELGWAVDDTWDIDQSDYLAMVRDKTCWYSVIHPLRLGALVGSRGRFDLDRMIQLGFLIGAVFQIHDDLENLVPPSTYDKDAGGDLVEGKRTLPILHFLRTAPAEEVAMVRGVLGPAARESAAERVAIVIPLLRAAGSVEYACSAAQMLAGAAIAEFGHVFGDQAVTDGSLYLAGLIHDLHERATSLI